MDKQGLKEAHTESTKPLSNEEQAQNINLSDTRANIAENNTRPVLVEVLKINGINHESLNISKSKFNKLNKLDLVNCLLDFEKQEPKQKSETKKEAAQDLINPFEQLSMLGSLIKEAYETKEYKKLDGVVAGTVFNSVGGSIDEETLKENEKLISYGLVGLGLTYGACRLIGFENIANKAKELKSKVFGGVENVKD